MLEIIRRNLMPLLCASVPPPVWHQLLSINLIIPHWHIISDRVQPHISGLYKYRNTKQFKADIDFFLKYYVPVSLTDIINYLDGRSQLPKRCFLPTFDDGFREVYEIAAPILYAKGIPGAFFLTIATIDNQGLCYPQKKSIIINRIKDLNNQSLEKEVKKILDFSGIPGENIISRISNVYYLQRHVFDELGLILDCDFEKYVCGVRPYLSIEQVKDLIKKGFDIGAHSLDHPLFSELSIEDQIFQTIESVEQLSKMLDYTCHSFAFPYGDSGISQEYFKNIFSHKQLKVTFGIGKILKDAHSRNLPRFSMERTDSPAEQILARQFGKALVHK